MLNVIYSAQINVPLSLACSYTDDGESKADMTRFWILELWSPYGTGVNLL